MLVPSVAVAGPLLEMATSADAPTVVDTVELSLVLFGSLTADESVAVLTIAPPEYVGGTL